MKKIALVLSAMVMAGVLSGCEFLSSPEKQAFDQFLAKCKAQPQSADCVAYEESKPKN